MILIEKNIKYIKFFKELPEQYKTPKFCKLYMKIDMFILLLNILNKKRYLGFSYIMIHIIKHFIEAKDFYHWKDRIYSLLTEKLASNSKRKYELLYGSKWKEFYRVMREKQKTTIAKKYNKIVERYKCFRDFPEQYKTEKFIALYSKMYEYMLSIPKEKIIISKIKNIEKRKRNEYIYCLFGYISKFIEAKDFYHWKDRIYSLLTEKLASNSKRKYKLFYGSKWEEFFKQFQKNQKATTMKHYKVENPFQSKEIKEKSKNTLLVKYNVINAYQLSKRNGSHSKIADDMCLTLDTLYGTLDTEDTRYATKNGEYFLDTKDNYSFLYDFTNIIEKWMVEFQGTYTHGLLEGQEYVYNIPVEEIYKKDEEKRLLAEQNGYKVFYVYENEYKSNKSKCLENLLKEIKNYVHSKENMI